MQVDNKKEFPKRKRNRLENYDYSSCGAYFITVCTLERRNYFWKNVGAIIDRPQDVELSTYGKMVDQAKYPFCLSCVVAWKLCDHAESYSPFITSLRWWIRATTGRPYNVTGCKTTERGRFQTSRDQYLAKIIPRSYYSKSRGLWRTFTIHLRKPNSLVLRWIIRRRIGVWALPDAGAFCNAVIQRRNWR